MADRRPDSFFIRSGWLVAAVGMLLGAAIWWAVATGRLPFWVVLL